MELQPNDPTPDPDGLAGKIGEAWSSADSEADAATKGTAFRDVAGAAREIAADGKVDGKEILDAAEEVAKAAGVTLPHHAITELRKLLVPILTALIAAGAAAGGIGFSAGEAGKDEAIREAVQRSSEDKRIRQALRRILTEQIRESASWDAVGATLERAQASDLADLFVKESGALPIEHDALVSLAQDEISQLRLIAPQSNQ